METRPRSNDPPSTARLLARRLDRSLRTVPWIREPVHALRRRQHIRGYEVRLFDAVSRRTDPYIDVARIVEVPTASIRRHTAVPGDYYPTQNPGAAIPGSWDLDAWLFEERAYYIQLREAVERQRPWEQTELYQGLVASASAMRSQWRRTELLREARETVEGYQQIYDSMMQNGYLSQEDLQAQRPRGYKPLQFDEISVAVARDGELQVCQGGHRFALAVAAGIRIIPVWIAARHSEWCDFRRQLIRAAETSGEGGAEPLLHPDLGGIPSSRRLQRVFQRALDLLPAPPGKIVDVDPGWGYCAHRCEELGFDCAVVVDDAEDTGIIERLRIASDKHFAVVRGLGRCATERPGTDILLGLRGFGAHLGTAETQSEFKSFLTESKLKVIIAIGTHDVVSLCSRAAGLSDVSTWMQDGRPMFRLS